jgi:hypothetical protein
MPASARSAIGGSTTLCDQSFDAVSVAASCLVAKDRVRDLVVEESASRTQWSQRAGPPAHAAELYWASGSSLP